jgi:hypothetical protein
VTVSSVFVSVAPEWATARQLLQEAGYEVRAHPAHHEYVFDDELVLDRVATGLRHALWYSVLAGTDGARVVQFDKTQLRVVADRG